MPEEKTVNISWRELTEGVERPSGAVHELVVQRAPVLVYNLENLPFSPDGAVLLPQEPSLAGGDTTAATPVAAPGADSPQPEQPSTGLLLLRELFADIDAVAGKKCLSAAHTDLLPGAPALELTQRRAQNLALYLQGDRDGWAKSCMPCQDTDWQTILQWVALRFGYPCDPGPIYDPLHASGRAALRRFRLRYNQDFGKKLEELGEISEHDFAAFYDLYDHWLTRMLEGENLSSKRAKLKFLDPAAVGCGASFPQAPPREPGFAPPQNRRAELLCFEGDEPNLEMVPPGVHVYALREFSLSRLQLESKECVLFEVAFSEDIVDALPDDATLELSGPPGPPQVRLLSHGQRTGGSVHYGFDWLDPSTKVTLEAKAGSRKVVLFKDQAKGETGEKLELSGQLEELLADEAPADESPLTQAGGLPTEPYEPFDESGSAFIELLVEDASGNPLSGERFDLVLPDGRRVSGFLDDEGKARIERVPGGVCALSLTNVAHPVTVVS
jgi:hypothetical protein